jgi:hypothetical protein
MKTYALLVALMLSPLAMACSHSDDAVRTTTTTTTTRERPAPPSMVDETTVIREHRESD